MGDKIVDIRKLKLKYQGNGTITTFHDLQDPKYIGPGMWYTIHINAIHANTKKLQHVFISKMND